MSDTAPSDPRWIALTRSPAVQAGAEAIALAMMAVAAAGLLVAAERREIVAAAAEDWLATQGVEADIEVEYFDASGFVGSIRAGPSANPVFTAERIEVAYDLSAPWAGGAFSVAPRAIRIVKPRLRVSFDGRKFSAGPLDPLISDFLARPKSDEPGPAVLIEQSLTTIATRQGDVRVSGDAALDDGQLLRFDGRLLPTKLKGTDFDFAFSGGRIRLRKTGEAITADLRLKVEDLTTRGVDLDGAEAALEGVIPYPNPDTQGLRGPAKLRAAVHANAAQAGEMNAKTLTVFTVLDGALAGDPATATFSGRMSGRAGAAVLSAGDLNVSGLRATVDSSQVTLGRYASALPFATRIEARKITAQGQELRAAWINASGRFNADKDGYALAAHGTGVADSGLGPARAREIAQAIPVLSSDPGQAQAVEQALRRFHAHARDIDFSVRNGDLKLALTGPVVIDAASGGQAVFTPHGRFALLGGKPGGFDLSIKGGGLPTIDADVSSWSFANGALDARLALTGAFEAPPAHNARVEAAGVLRMRGGRTVFTLTQCGQAAADTIDFGDIDVADASARLCPGDTPLINASGGNWQVAGRFERAAATLPAWTVAASDAVGSFNVGGRGDMDRADIALSAARLTDTAETVRFKPVRASGRAELAGGVWRGAFPVTSDAGYPVADVALTHEVASGRGRADIDARGLVFAKEGLQPSDLSPITDIAREAEGPAAFTGELTWAPEGVTSAGRLSTTGLNFRSPAGQITGLRTDIDFVSLAPLVSASDQQLTLERLSAIVPLTDVKARFNLTETAAHIDGATASAADGRIALEPLDVPFAPDPTIRGVLDLERINIGALVADTTLADRIQVDAVVNGHLPFEMSPEGLRFTQGKLHAVQPGRISISRRVLSNVESAAPDNPMDATTPAPQVNAVQDFAYQAMENLSFNTLEATLNSTDNGRLGVLFHIEGHHEPEVAEEARISIQDALAGNAFTKRIPLPKGTPVNLTLDTSLNFAELLAAWRRGWKDAAEP